MASPPVIYRIARKKDSSKRCGIPIRLSNYHSPYRQLNHLPHSIINGESILRAHQHKYLSNIGTGSEQLLDQHLTQKPGSAGNEDASPRVKRGYRRFLEVSRPFIFIAACLQANYFTRNCFYLQSSRTRRRLTNIAFYLLSVRTLSKPVLLTVRYRYCSLCRLNEARANY